MNKLSKIIGLFIWAYITDAFAIPDKEFYASINGGVFQANFNTRYLDQTDIIAQNISESVLQNGYVGGIALGYNQRIRPHFFLGGEISAHINSNSAEYQNGTAAFSDSIKWKHYFDFSLVSEITSELSFIPYLKLGLSYAAIADNLISPTGYNPNISYYSKNNNALGFAASLGLKHVLNKKIALFSEINYHDYGTLHFQNFQNFTADYTHTARLFSYGLLVGAAYTFNA